MTKNYKDEIEEILNKAGELQKANKTSKHSDSFYQKLNKMKFYLAKSGKLPRVILFP